MLLWPEAAGLSATTISRLISVWQEEYRAWRKRSLADKDYVYIWADGLYFQVRLEEDRLACLVIIGVRRDGTKEVIALEDGYRESTEAWSSLLRDLKRAGHECASTGRGRRRAGLLGCPAGSLPSDARTALLGA